MSSSLADSVDMAEVGKVDGRADFLGAVILPTDFTFEGTQVGGLSGITYDRANDRYLAISDDRSQVNDARFYELGIDLSGGVLHGVQFTGVTTLKRPDGTPFPERSLDPEGIALTSDGALYISSEGDASQLIDPFVDRFSLDGEELSSLPIPAAFLPSADGESGIRNNLAFESLTITPNKKYLFTATENALVQDGPASSLDDESPSRIVKYDLETGQVVAEYIYETDAIPHASEPAGGYADNGLVELLALDNTGTLLALERSYASGVGNSIRLYEVHTQGATDVSGFDSVDGFSIDAVADKRLLLDLADLGITLDNVEGMTFGPVLEDGRQSLILVSDNNFSQSQKTEVIAIALDVEKMAALPASGEGFAITGSEAADPALLSDQGDALFWTSGAAMPGSLFGLMPDQDAHAFTSFETGFCDGFIEASGEQVLPGRDDSPGSYDSLVPDAQSDLEGYCGGDGGLAGSGSGDVPLLV